MSRRNYGITRLNVLRLCEKHQIPFDERDISLAELYMADEIFCTGTMGGLAPVVEIDGRMIGEVGAVYEKLGELFRKPLSFTFSTRQCGTVVWILMMIRRLMVNFAWKPNTVTGMLMCPTDTNKKQQLDLHSESP